MEYYYIAHSAKGSSWKNHKYIKKIGNTYIYAKEQLEKYAEKAKNAAEDAYNKSGINELKELNAAKEKTEKANKNLRVASQNKKRGDQNAGTSSATKVGQKRAYDAAVYGVKNAEKNENKARSNYEKTALGKLSNPTKTAREAANSLKKSASSAASRASTAVGKATGTYYKNQANSLNKSAKQQQGTVNRLARQTSQAKKTATYNAKKTNVKASTQRKYTSKSEKQISKSLSSDRLKTAASYAKANKSASSLATAKTKLKRTQVAAKNATNKYNNSLAGKLDKAINKVANTSLYSSKTTVNGRTVSKKNVTVSDAFKNVKNSISKALSKPLITSEKSTSVKSVARGHVNYVTNKKKKKK